MDIYTFNLRSTNKIYNWKIKWKINSLSNENLMIHFCQLMLKWVDLIPRHEQEMNNKDLEWYGYGKHTHTLTHTHTRNSNKSYVSNFSKKHKW